MAKTTMWIARDVNDNSLYLYTHRPTKDEKGGIFNMISGEMHKLPSRFFPDVSWENSPQEVKVNPISE